MTGHLYIHIGPPKTATTSLQYAFGDLQHPSFVYIGVVQPRDTRDRGTVHRLHEATVGADRRTRAEVSTAVSELRDIVAAGKLALVSEEMFLVTQKRVGWRQKLFRLRELLGDIPTTILITVRDPREGVPSLYQELYRKLPLRLKLSFDAFCRDERSACFDYAYVRRVLTEAGFKDVRAIDFDLIRTGRLQLRDVLGIDTVPDDPPLTTGMVNVGRKSSDGGRELKAVTLKSMFNNKFLYRIVNAYGLRGSASFRALAMASDRVVLLRGGSRILELPSDRAEMFETSYRAALMSCSRSVLHEPAPNNPTVPAGGGGTCPPAA